jgi:antitoxin component YwqK of YwqJK toxin-antitoxin module
MYSVKHYRSSIPQAAEERVLATHVSGPRKYKAEYRLDEELVGIRYFSEAGELESEIPLKNGRTHGILYFFDQDCSPSLSLTPMALPTAPPSSGLTRGSSLAPTS